MNDDLCRRVYTLPEVARLTRVNVRVVREWLAGEEYACFLDLIDLGIVGQFGRRGTPPGEARKMYDGLRKQFGWNHPFADRRFAEHHHNELSETIDYDPETGTALRWRIADGVVIDPARYLGQPLIDALGIKTAVLAAAFEANDHDADKVAWWFNVTAETVQAAVAFERGWRRDTNGVLFRPQLPPADRENVRRV